MRMLALVSVLAACAQPLAHEPVGEFLSDLRPDDPRTTDLYRYDTGDVVLEFDTPEGHFRVRYTKEGRHRVPAADVNDNGVPDFVETAGAAYEASWAHYHEVRGFRQPLRAANEARFGVYLLDFAGNGDGSFRSETCGDDGTCAGFMVQENDFAGYGYISLRDANRILASHEYFHAIQAAYRANAESVPSEGTAVWATEDFDGRLTDFENFLHGYLENASRSIDEPLPGPVDPFSYGSALWFRFLTERFDVDVVRDLWERLAAGTDGSWVAALAHVLETKHRKTFSEAFLEFTDWNLRIGKWADPALSYDNGAKYGALKIENETLPWREEKLRVFHASTRYTAFAPAGRAAITAALVPAAGATLDGLVLSIAKRVAPSTTTITRLDDLRAGTQTISVSGVSEIIVSVVNVLPDGNSIRPSLCVGTKEEVAACVAELTPPAPEPEPGPEPEPEPKTKPDEDEGGCAQAGAGWVAMAIAIGRIRRRLR